MKLNSFTLAALIVFVLFGGIGVSTAMNWWQTETTKVPVTYTEGEFAGEYNPADIRGSYTFGDVSELFNIPLSDLQTAFNLPDDTDPASYGLKNLETVTADLPVEVGTASVRMFVAFYKGLPYDLSLAEETYLFPEAMPILQSQNTMLPEQVAYLESHLVPVENEQIESVAEPVENIPVTTTPVPADEAVTADPTEHVEPDRTVTGKTTFQDVLDWGVSQEIIESILGGEMPSPQMTIKDYATQNGIAFSELKTKIQTEIDNVEQ